jgi:hypothetical protein
MQPGPQRTCHEALRPGAEPVEFTSPAIDMFAAMFAAFCDAVRGERPYPYPLSAMAMAAASLELAGAVPAVAG